MVGYKDLYQVYETLKKLYEFSTVLADWAYFGYFAKGTILSESTDMFVITPNRQTFFFPETEIWILVIFKAALTSQRWPSCPSKPLSFQNLRHPQFLSNFPSPKFDYRRQRGNRLIERKT